MTNTAIHLADEGRVASAQEWAVRLNVSPQEVRDGAQVPGSQGLLVFRPWAPDNRRTGLWGGLGWPW